MLRITYKNDISVADYNALRISAGWREIHPEQAAAGFAGSALIVPAQDGDKTAGTARLVWDGGYAALIKDVLVLPEYQGKGIGTAMVQQLLAYLQNQMKPGWSVSVDLMSAMGKENFYKKLGFASRPRENRGAGMDMQLVKVE